MQARYASLLLATAIVAAAGVAAAQQAVQAPPQQASQDYYLKLGDIEGDVSESDGRDVQSQSGGPQAGLLLPAIQKVREVAPESTPQQAPSSPPPPPPPPPPPSPNGHVPVDQITLNFEKGGVPGSGHDVAAPAPEPQAALIVPAVQRVRDAASPPPPPQNAETGRDISTGGQAIVPEVPICANCSVHGAVEANAQSPEEQPRERPRRNFSLSIGGITVGTNGVNVAVGDVNGDGRHSPPSSSSPSTTRAPTPAPTRTTAGAGRRN